MYRMNGHYEKCKPLNVVQHSMLVADLAYAEEQPPYVFIMCLLHDLHEAYTGDVTSPTKILTGYEDPTHIKWAVRFALGGNQQWNWSKVKKYDLLSLDIERRAMFHEKHGNMGWPGTSLDVLTTKECEHMISDYSKMGINDFMYRYKVSMNAQMNGVTHVWQ